MNLELPLVDPRSQAVIEAIEALASQGTLENRGAVFTRTAVIEAILDLCGYTTDEPLHRLRLLEPSFGDGDFLLVAIDRLIEAWKTFGGGDAEADLADAIRGVELHTATFDSAHTRVVAHLQGHGLAHASAVRLADDWLINDDFLLTYLEEGSFDLVVGNPPYVRQERIPKPLLAAYKLAFETLYDRADLYILFYERGLNLLAEGGHLGYICANRWLKNKYGGPLRQKVADEFRLKFFIDLERADAFHASVSAYPAITIIERGNPGQTYIALQNRESADGLQAVARSLLASSDGHQESAVTIVDRVANQRDPWLLDAPQILGVLRTLEDNYPSVEESGASVGIGVATGADRIFIQDFDTLPIEGERKLKLAMAADCIDGEVVWGGRGVVNPYLTSGQLAALEDFPAFARYLNAHGDVLRQRHTARKQPTQWYRTIDRIYPQLASTPKLLIPDIKGEAAVAYDPGTCYPHHNLYVVTSAVWDLRALQAVLRSSVALMFVAAYCVRMAGGFLRFQAQYIRRIRVPDPAGLTEAQVVALAEVSTSRNLDEVDAVVLPLFGLSPDDARSILEFANASRVPRKTR